MLQLSSIQDSLAYKELREELREEVTQEVRQKFTKKIRQEVRQEITKKVRQEIVAEYEVMAGIRILQEMQGLPVQSRETLRKLPLAELRNLSDELKSREA